MCFPNALGRRKGQEFIPNMEFVSCTEEKNWIITRMVSKRTLNLRFTPYTTGINFKVGCRIQKSHSNSLWLNYNC